MNSYLAGQMSILTWLKTSSCSLLHHSRSGDPSPISPAPLTQSNICVSSHSLQGFQNSTKSQLQTVARTRKGRKITFSLYTGGENFNIVQTPRALRCQNFRRTTEKAALLIQKSVRKVALLDNALAMCSSSSFSLCRYADKIEVTVIVLGEIESNSLWHSVICSVWCVNSKRSATAFSCDQRRDNANISFVHVFS